MEKIDNELMDLSSWISNVEIALNEYANAPESGLKSLRLSLTFLQNNISSSSFHDLFQSRIDMFIGAIDSLALSGSPYSSQYHIAFLSALDAFSQVFIGSQFGADRSRQLSSVFSMERSCWSVLSLLANAEQSHPIYGYYEAKLNIVSTKIEFIAVDDYLKSLSDLGRVTFSLDEVGELSLSGRFFLQTVQSMAWLKQRFPILQWSLAVSDDVSSLRDLCEVSFLPLFQHRALNRESRYTLLEKFESQFKSLFYKKFGELFISDFINVKQMNRLVPVLSNKTYPNEIDPVDDGMLSVYSPVRHGGFFYKGLIAQETLSNVSYLERLGQDILSNFLYKIETKDGCFVFDKIECIGCRQMTLDNTVVIDRSIWFQLNEEIQAQVFIGGTTSPLTKGALFQSKQRIDVLVVEQVGEYFALPFLSIKEVEGVAVQMRSPRLWTKNIWLTKENKPLLEPWLVSLERLPDTKLLVSSDAVQDEIKQGYYLGKIYGKSFWIEASLMLSVLPYQSPFILFDFDGKKAEPFIIHDGRCFDRVVHVDDVVHGESSRNKLPIFSVILEWSGKTLVLPFDSCDWSVSLPENVIGKCADSSAFEMSDNHVLPFLESSLVIIDRTNFLSLIDGFWSSSLSFGSDY